MSAESSRQGGAEAGSAEGSARGPNVLGQAMQAGRVQVHDARLELRDSGQRLYLIALDSGEQLYDCAPRDVRLEPPLGSAPRRLVLPGGHLFLTEDPAIIALVGPSQDRDLLSRLERSWRWVAAAVLLTAGLGWLLWSEGLPYAVRAAATMTPQSWVAQMDDSSLTVLGFQFTIYDAPNTAERLAAKRIVERLAAELDQPLDLKLKFIDIQEPNAFALPGGTLLVTQGLLERFGEDEGALAAVLGHEIAHVSECHGLQNLYSSSAVYLAAALLFGDVGPMFETLLVEGQALLTLVYSRDHESEADRVGAALSQRAGYDPRGLIRFLQALQEEVGDGDVPAWRSTHPGLSERIEALRKQLN